MQDSINTSKDNAESDKDDIPKVYIVAPEQKNMQVIPNFEVISYPICNLMWAGFAPQLW